MTAPFTPPAWAMAHLAASTEYGRALSEAMARHSPYVFEQVPRSEEWIAAREAFTARWKAIIDEGLEQGYLDQDSCYECAGALELTTSTTVAVRHPNPDWRPFEPGDTVTIPRG